MLCGVDDWQDFGLHDCRHEFVTRLVNSPEVSVSETMAAARHTSISASKQYQQIDNSSEMAKFRATLGHCPSLQQTSMKHPSEMHPSVNSFISASQLLKMNNSNVSTNNAGYIIHPNTNVLPSMKHNPSEESISLYHDLAQSIFSPN